ncbi:hypothetical protein CHS0354_037039 [Potamilus streckersoni]|uniref:PDZ domain-containing protein n=1 Tax=Potamilus streckersoni TaxID=2493646 RepID=A0AAE0SL20_9BIVA|nr:hypothetical protein CHS0354_037039 [Potamilus streckersoni]
MEKRRKPPKMVKEKPAHFSVGDVHPELDADKTVITNPEDNRRRRTLKLYKKDNSWGFTLQSYGIKHKKTNEVEIMTYVDYIEIGGPAWLAGMRRGDVIISINGNSVEKETHRGLVQRIRNSGHILRLVVLFEDCCKKVELHERYLSLKMILLDKMEELKELERKEREILYGKISRFDNVRQSIISSTSTDSNSWDCYSLISSPNFPKSSSESLVNWPSTSSVKSFDLGEGSSGMDDECFLEENLEYIDNGSDTDDSNSNVAFDSEGISDGDILGRTVESNQNMEIDNTICKGKTDQKKNKEIIMEQENISSEAVHAKSKTNTSLNKDEPDSHINDAMFNGVLPEIVISFHSEGVVYVNDKDEVTKL